LSFLARNWWLVALRGGAAVVFGLATFLWPEVSLLVLVLLFGAYAVVDGVFLLASAYRTAQRRERWWPQALQGVAGIAAGGIALAWPGIAALALVYLIAAWAFVTGVLEVFAAVRLRRVLTNEWILALAGVLAIVFALGVAIFPSAGALAIVWVIGAWAIIFGVLLMALSLRLRDLESMDRSRGGVQPQARAA
jgi:uncharacterized membrane protein HdeD (DUF308 family)